MDSENLIEVLKKKGIDPNNISQEDILTIIDMQIKGEFGKDVFKELMNSSNLTYKQYLELLSKIIESDKDSSKVYEETLSWLVKDLRKEAEKAETDEEKEKIHKKIENLLDRMEQEANKKRDHGMKYALLATGALTIVGGIGVYTVTKNPTLLKKGTEMIGKAAVQQVLK